MDAKECADVLQATIRHRERMHKEEMILLGENGEEKARGKINPDADMLYQALRFALACVEEIARK